jgi:hypothetical protein
MKIEATNKPQMGLEPIWGSKTKSQLRIFFILFLASIYSSIGFSQTSKDSTVSISYALNSPNLILTLSDQNLPKTETLICFSVGQFEHGFVIIKSEFVRALDNADLLNEGRVNTIIEGGPMRVCGGPRYSLPKYIAFTGLSAKHENYHNLE